MPFVSPSVSLGEAQPSIFGDPHPATEDDLPGTTLNGLTGRNSSPPTAYSKRRGRPTPTVIIHHSALLRAGLAHILAETQFRVRTQCSSFEHLPQRALAGEQCLALIGIDHSDPGAVLSEIPYLKSQRAHVHVIVLGEQLRERELLTFIEGGADGYLLISEITPEFLLGCLEVIVLGGVVIPRGSITIRDKEAAVLYDASDLIESASPSASVPTPMQEPAHSAEFSGLSNREQTILKGIMQGASNKHIARSLDIAEATVKVHVKSLLRKLRVNNRTQAAMWAMQRSGATDQLVISPDQRDAAVHSFAVDATSRQLENVATQASTDLQAKGEERKSLIDAAIATPQLEAVSPLVKEVICYLRQQDDVIVHERNGIYLVNGRFRLETAELIDKANRIRQRQDKSLFI